MKFFCDFRILKKDVDQVVARSCLEPRPTVHQGIKKMLEALGRRQGKPEKLVIVSSNPQDVVFDLLTVSKKKRPHQILLVRSSLMGLTQEDLGRLEEALREEGFEVCVTNMACLSV